VPRRRKFWRRPPVDLSGIWALPTEAAALRSQYVNRALDSRGRLQLPVAFDGDHGCLYRLGHQRFRGLQHGPGGRPIIQAGTCQDVGPDRLRAEHREGAGIGAAAVPAPGE
jgi:hypothetical protein